MADPDTAEGADPRRHHDPGLRRIHLRHTGHPQTDGGATAPENLNALADSTDMVEALNRLQAMAPAVESVSLVVAWFGDDLAGRLLQGAARRRGDGQVDHARQLVGDGVSRASAFLVSRDDQDRPVYGGTPSDFAVVQALQG